MNVRNIFKEFDFKKLISKLEKYKYVLIVILVGIVLMLLPTSGNSDDIVTQEPVSAEQNEDFDLGAFEKRLEEIISQIDGAGQTSVVLTLQAGMETILAEQTESSQDREVNEVVTVSQGSGYTEAVITKRLYPQFQGALIVCQGGDSANVRLAIVNAVASLTGLGSDKITVVKMKN